MYDRPAYAIGEHAGENDKSPEQEEEYRGDYGSCALVTKNKTRRRWASPRFELDLR